MEKGVKRKSRFKNSNFQKLEIEEKGNVCQALEIEWKLSLSLAQQKCEEISKVYIQTKSIIDWVA